MKSQEIYCGLPRIFDVVLEAGWVIYQHFWLHLKLILPRFEYTLTGYDVLKFRLIGMLMSSG